MPDKKTDFDGYADNYDQILSKNLGVFSEDVSKFTRYKVEYLRSKVSRQGCILDFGCGTGKAMEFFEQMYPESELYGCDVSEKSLELAKKNHAGVKFFCVEKPEDMVRYKGKFDLIFISCVFHHIPPPERPSWMMSLTESLSDKGVIAIFEHNPYNPLTRHFVSTCEFDADAVLLSANECKRLTGGGGY